MVLEQMGECADGELTELGLAGGAVLWEGKLQLMVQ